MTPPVQPVPGQPVPAAPAPAPGAPPIITGQQLNARIQHGDPSFPKELWGRTLGEAMRYYAIMREDFMKRNQPDQQPPLAGQPRLGQPAPAPAPAPSGYQPAQPAPSGYQPPAPAPAPMGMDAESMQRMIAQAVQTALAPMARQAADTTYDRMRREYPDWDAYNAEILQTLEGASPEQLANPETWRTAYFFVKGKQLSQPAAAPPAPARDPWNPAAPTITPAPAPAGYFAEGPSAPAPAGGASPSSLVNDPRVLAMARRFGVAPEEYVLWMNGNVPPMPAPAGGAPRA